MKTVNSKKRKAFGFLPKFKEIYHNKKANVVGKYMILSMKQVLLVFPILYMRHEN